MSHLSAMFSSHSMSLWFVATLVFGGMVAGTAVGLMLGALMNMAKMEPKPHRAPITMPERQYHGLMLVRR